MNLKRADLDLLVVTDSPQEVCDLVMKSMAESSWYEKKAAAARRETRKVFGK